MNKRKNVIFVKGDTLSKMLFLGMFTREKSFNQLLEKIHKKIKPLTEVKSIRRKV